jgi:hypothetical protein
MSRHDEWPVLIGDWPQLPIEGLFARGETLEPPPVIATYGREAEREERERAGDRPVVSTSAEM